MRKSFFAMLVLAVTVIFATGYDADMASAKAKTIKIKVAYGNQPGEPTDLAMHRWADLVKEQSNGKVIMQLFPSSQLGEETEVIEQGMMGGNIICISSPGYLMNYVPDLGITNAPFLTRSVEEKLALLKTDWYRGLEAQLEEKGLHMVIDNFVYGTRHLLTTKEVKTPADLAGVKVRCQNSRLFLATVKGMGATPTPMALGDVYTGIAQGVVDGVENPAVVLYGGKFYEVAKHLALTGHMQMVVEFVAGSKFWSSLPKDVQEMLVKTGSEAAAWNNANIAKAEQDGLDKLKAKGVIINEVDQDAFRKSSRSAYDAFPEWTPGLYDKIQKIVESL